MSKSRFAEARIMGGMPVAEPFRKHGIGSATFHE